MKKQYENLQLEIQLFSNQDVITSSVFVEWNNNWNSNGDQDNGWASNIFG